LVAVKVSHRHVSLLMKVFGGLIAYYGAIVSPTVCLMVMFAPRR